jgi:hypothetical protein
MSANGAVTTTLDFQYFGGGVIQVSGGLSGVIDNSFVFDGVVPIVGHIEPVTIDFSFGAGIETPTIYGKVEDASFDFTSYSFVEFGVQRYLSVANNTLFDYSATSEGYVTTHVNFNPTLDFNLDTHIYVFSLGDGNGVYSFSVDSLGLNVSTREYSKTGGNYVTFDGIDNNEYRLVDPTNGLNLISNGMSKADILQT